MARIFITGSADGLGKLAAQELIRQGHQVVIHARNEQRAKDAHAQIPKAEQILIGDLGNITQTIQLASKVNALGKFDAVIQNAGIYNGSGEDLLKINALAPYILTCLIEKPQRLIYLSSDMHMAGSCELKNIKSDFRHITYSDSKLFTATLCMAVARKWPTVYANAIEPGWVPTKMGGKGAPDSLQDGYRTQVWLAASSDELAKVNGRYFFHQKEVRVNQHAKDVRFQEDFLRICEEITGVAFHEY